MAKKAKNFHIGGVQMPLIVPDSKWKPPTSLPDLRRKGVIAVDLETFDPGLAAGRGPSWPYGRGHIAGVAVAWNGGAFYAPVRHPDTENLDEELVKRWLKDHHLCKDLQVVYQNGASYDIGWEVCSWDVPPPINLEDTVAMAVMADENRLSYELDELCKHYGIPGKDEHLLKEAAAAYGFHPKADMHLLPARFVGPYAEQDPRATLGLFHKIDPILDKENTRKAYRLEMDLVPMTTEMRKRGIKVNLERAEQFAQALEQRRDQCLAQLSDKLSHNVGMDEVRSPGWCEKVFSAYKIPFGRTAPTKQHPDGQASFQRKWMLKHEHWLPQLVARAEQAEEMASKFIRGMIIGYSHRGRLHSCINQFRSEEGGTRSHRFSYSDPALQQAPSRDEEFSEIFRGCFEPEEGEVWGKADYSQQEYRLIVHYAVVYKCHKAMEAAMRYKEDPKTDFHMYVAEITGLPRKPAKDTNFAKAFGAGVGKFASMTGMSLEKARETMNQYDEELPFVKQLADKCSKGANRQGYITLIDGARCHFDYWEVAWREEGEPYEGPRPYDLAVAKWPDRRLKRAFTHKAMNRKIQGSAARQTKAWMLGCYKEGLLPLLQLHDELDFSFSKEKDAKRIVEIGQDVIKLEVPMLIDMAFGPSWGTAGKIEKDKKVVHDGSWRSAVRMGKKA